MDENRNGINWLGLFIKVIVFVVVVLFAIWLFSKLTLRNKGLSFEENNKLFKDASVEYFKKNLPDNGKSKTVTLSQLIGWDYLDELDNEDGKICDIRNSKSKIEIVDDYYNIKSILVCGNKSETSYIKLGNEECTKCDIRVNGLKMPTDTKEEEETKEESKENTKDEKETNNSVSKNDNESSKGTISNNQTNNSTKTVLYEYVKDNIEYTEWYVGKVTGNNIENSTQNVSYSKYCKNEKYTYYTVSYETKKTDYSYTIELKNLDNIESLKLNSSNYFTNSDYKTYVNNKKSDLTMVGGTDYYLPSANTIKNASLTSKNFKFEVSKVYEKNGKFYADINVKIKNLTDVTPYYLSSIKKDIYYVPVKFAVSYVDKDNCIADRTDKSNNYADYTIVDTWNEKVDVYRHKIVTKEYKYSSQTSLPGYTKTGNTKIAG